MKPSIGTTSTGAVIGIDVDRLIETRAIVTARSGAGKSWALRRILEQTHGKVQQIVIDPEGEFFTLREKYDYVLAGGLDGDCPADTRCAALLARRLLELRVSAIIDIYELKVANRIHFVKLFLESMIDAPKSLWHPVLVIVDEAQLFAPESGKCESTQAVVDLMTRGRKRGFAGLLATFRHSVIDKNASAPAINKLIGGTSQDVDVERAGKDLGFKRDRWMELQGLKPGVFFALGPAFCDTVTELMVGPVVTTHPRAGQRALAPPPPKESVKRILATLADLPHEAEQEAQTVGDLKRKIRELESQIHGTQALLQKAQSQPEATKEFNRLHKEYGDKIAARDVEIRRLRSFANRALPLIASIAIEKTRPAEDVPFVADDRFDSRRVAVPPRVLPVESNGHGSAIAKGERKLLVAIAQRPAGITTETLAVLTGYKATSRRIYLQTLCSDGLAARDGKLFRVTEDGLRKLGNSWEPLPVGDALLQHWLKELPEGERKILQVAVAAHPEPVSKDAIAEATGYKATSVRIYSQNLVSRQLLSRDRGALKASEELFS